MNKINIPQPCHESWDEMNPEGDGRHCLSCSKVVVDFTQMSLPEIHDYFYRYQDREICGTFRNDTVDIKVQKPIEKGVFKYLERINKVAATIIFGVFVSFASCRSKHVSGKVAYVSGSADSDNDGIFDIKDECPYVAGKPEYFGCPDSDEDGIGDSKDKCPFEAGIAENTGCPETKNLVMGVPQRPQEHYFKIRYTSELIFEDGSFDKFIEIASASISNISYRRIYIVIYSIKNEKKSVYLKRRDQIEKILTDRKVSKGQLIFDNRISNSDKDIVSIEVK